MRVLLALVVGSAACGQATPPGTPVAPSPSPFANVDEALAAMAWPDVPVHGATGRPRIGMARLPRPARWPNLRAWRAGRVIDREPTFTPVASARELEILGEQVFRTYCAACHGRSGHGDGPMGRRLRPQPRDFTRGAFKFRSTPSGEPPLTRDLFRTLTGGLHATGMMSFADLPEEERWAVATYVRTLSPVFARATHPIEVPAAPLDLHARAAAGAAVYRRAGCHQCHGPTGLGDGPSAATLRDDRGNPVIMPNLVRGPLKRGRNARELYTILSTGLDGTPMPSYKDALAPDDMWALVAFLISLGNPSAPALSQR